MSAGPKRKVLFVDDAPDEAELYAEYFDRKSDVVPMTALSADEALARLGSESESESDYDFASGPESDIDCLVSDSVHTADGEPLVAAAKRADPDLPVLLYSGGSPADLPTDVADGYLPKGARSGAGTTLEALHERIRDLTPAPGRDGDWQRLGTFDWTEWESPSVAAVNALADRTAFDPTGSPPLFDTVDPDGVDSLVTHATAAGRPDDVTVTFAVGDYAVRMSSGGAVDYRVRRADR